MRGYGKISWLHHLHHHVIQPPKDQKWFFNSHDLPVKTSKVQEILDASQNMYFFKWFNVSRHSSAQLRKHNNWGIWLQLLRMVQIPTVADGSDGVPGHQFHAGFFSLHNFHFGEISPQANTPYPCPSISSCQGPIMEDEGLEPMISSKKIIKHGWGFRNPWCSSWFQKKNTVSGQILKKNISTGINSYQSEYIFETKIANWVSDMPLSRPTLCSCLTKGWKFGQMYCSSWALLQLTPWFALFLLHPWRWTAGT